MAKSFSHEKFSIPFTFTLPHLKITYEPQEYLDLYQKYKVVSLDAGEAYWLHLSDYLVARCPLCSAPYYERIDTHSLRQLQQNPTSKPTYIGLPKYQTITCPHFVAVTTFVNLNSLLPTEHNLWSCNTGDIPAITPSLLPDDIESAAVIHSLPVCRIEENAFIPRYSLYMVTYFASDPAAAWKQRENEMDKIADSLAGGDEDFALHISWINTSCACRNNPALCNLTQWVERKKLYWLDLHSRDLPLRQGPIEEFPYANIQGYGQPYTYLRHGTWPWEKWLYPNGRVQLIPCI